MTRLLVPKRSNLFQTTWNVFSLIILYIYLIFSYTFQPFHAFNISCETFFIIKLCVINYFTRTRMLRAWNTWNIGTSLILLRYSVPRLGTGLEQAGASCVLFDFKGRNRNLDHPFRFSRHPHFLFFCSFDAL